MKGIGYFLGATLGAALLFFIISFIFLRPRKVNSDEINKYIFDSDKILISEPIPFWSEYKGDDKRLGGNSLNKMTYFSNRNMTYVRGVTYTYFCKELNKYVITYTISEGGGGYLIDISGGISLNKSLSVLFFLNIIYLMFLTIW